jgi:hypothetical protein
MKFLPMLLAAASLFAVSCERHEFEGEHGTKQLHSGHGSHSGDQDKHPAETPGH